jgi:lysophospholipase L1-like esterase
MKTGVIKLAALALLLLPALVMGADAPFEKEIKAFEAADAKQAPPKDAVLFIGSSSIRMWTTLAADFPGVPVINRGFGGSQIADSVRYADRIAVPYHPRRIVIYAGDNDIGAGKTPRQVLEEFQAFVAKVREGLPDVPVDFISIKPSIKRWKLVDRIKEANALIEQWAKEQKNIGYIDCFTPMLGPDGKPREELFRPDGLHMTKKGYDLWVSIIKPRLEAGH